jgi:hypothetical protein
MADDRDYRAVEWFSWDVFRGCVDDVGACGVSGDLGRATRALLDALRTETPSAWGEVWQVEPIKTGRATTYEYVSRVTRILQRPSSGTAKGGH